MSIRVWRLFAVWIAITGVVPAQDKSLTPQAAITRGLDFLQADAVKWRTDKQCSTCHHGTMTVWALSEAKSRGYEIPAETFAENVSWMKERLLAKIDEPRDTLPGHRMVNSSALYLAVMAWCVPEQEALSADELRRIAGHLLRHQESDGSWSWSSAPPKNRPPPFFESDEVATLLGSAALREQLSVDADDESEIPASREKAAEWLAGSEPTGTTQAAAYRLLVTVQGDESAEQRQEAIDGLLTRQNPDGGWGQLDDAASDAYATGQVLYVLNLAGIQPEHDAVLQGVSYLVSTQNADGSWPMTRRGHPGVTPSDFKIPIVYFGSAWATMGLLRSVAN